MIVKIRPIPNMGFLSKKNSPGLNIFVYCKCQESLYKKCIDKAKKPMVQGHITKSTTRSNSGSYCTKFSSVTAISKLWSVLLTILMLLLLHAGRILIW